jgi:AraC-like DNA-binding protein
MRYEEHPVPAALRRHVECFWSLSSEGRPAPPEAGCVLPDGGVEVVVGRADSGSGAGGVRLERMLVGPLERPVRVRYPGRVELVAARFRPTAARGLASGPMRGLANAVHPLSRVSPVLDARIAREMEGCRSRPRRLAALARALIEHLPTCPPPDAVVEEAARRIAASGGRVGIGALARSVGVGLRALERRFDDAVGMSPRRLARVLRFRRAWEAATEAQSRAWSLLALDCGYADQAHLIREFRTFSGSSPGRVARSRGRRRSAAS